MCQISLLFGFKSLSLIFNKPAQVTRESSTSIEHVLTRTIRQSVNINRVIGSLFMAGGLSKNVGHYGWSTTKN